MEHHQTILQLHILETCASDTCRNFLQHSQILSCQRKKLCLRARESNERIFFLLEGKAAVYNLTRCGRRKILFILGAGSLVNESLTGTVNHIYCEALETCRFLVIPRERLLALMEADFQLTKALLACQERKVWRLEHQLKNTVSSIYLERKLAAKLWKLSRDFGVRTEKGILIDMDLSVTFLADFLGAPRETTSRVCRRLSELGLIVMEKKKIYIPDHEGISHFYRTSTI